MQLSGGPTAGSRRRAPIAAALLALAAATMVSAPALAAYPPWYTSSVQCRYRADATGERVLTKIVVTPPSLYADSEPADVGWRVVVRRSLNLDLGPWKIRYRTPIEIAEATEDQPGAFETASIDVIVPDIEDLSSVRYRVTLKMMWYASDGTVMYRLSHRMESLKLYWKGNFQRIEGDYCPASLDTGP